MEYRYYIAGQRVYPFNTRELSIKTKKEEDYIFYRDKLDGNITLCNNPKLGIEDYTFLKNIDDGLSQYTKSSKIPFLINQYNGVSETLRWEGEFTCYDCKFDVERATVTFSPTVKDKYSKFFEYGDKEINLLDGRISRYYSIGIQYKSFLEFEFASFNISNPSQGEIDATEPDGDEWNIWFEDDREFVYGPSTRYLVVWARQKIYLPKGMSASGWTSVDSETNDYISTYVKDFSSDYEQPNKSEVSYVVCDGEDKDNTWYKIKDSSRLISSGGILGRCRAYSVLVLKTIYNGGIYAFSEDHNRCFNLRDFINALVENCDSSYSDKVVSSFFFNDPYEIDYGSSVDSSLNYITERTNELNNLYIEEKSDFLKPNASQYATIGKLTFKKFFDDLNNLFAGNVYWFIDSEDNFRIEHINYFQGREGLDLTTSNYLKFISQCRGYEYKNKEIPSRDIWSMNEVGNIDFVENQITYGEFIAIDGIKENKNEYKVNNFFTDIDWILNHIDEASRDGFVFIVAYESSPDVWICKQTEGILSGNTLQNANLSFANLLDDYSKYNRPLDEFTLNGSSQNAITLKKLKQQDEIEFTNFEEDIDFSKLITTQLGAGEVEEATDYFEKRTIKLVLNHV